MRYAILSDVHGRRHKLEVVLADAGAKGAQGIVSLGDVGGEDCLELLWQVEAMAVFGNYEVSGWRRLPPRYRAWVETWPPLLVEERFLAVHAVPWWPQGLDTISDFGDWLKRTGRPWRALFPYLTEDPDHVWQAIVELEAEGKTLLFHGHTHQQAAWRWGPTGYLRQLPEARITVGGSHLYVVGVGSVGLPEDGCWAAYTIYDAATGSIEPVRLERPRRGNLP
jgi:predicted phosphodiesterase